MAIYNSTQEIHINLLESNKNDEYSKDSKAIELRLG